MTLLVSRSHRYAWCTRPLFAHALFWLPLKLGPRIFRANRFLACCTIHFMFTICFFRVLKHHSDQVVVLIMSVCFIAFVTMLHAVAKLYQYRSSWFSTNSRFGRARVPVAVWQAHCVIVSPILCRCQTWSFLSQNSPPKQFLKRNLGITHQLRGYCYALKFIPITARLGASQCKTRARFCLIEVLDSRYPNHATNFGLYMHAKLLSFSQGEAWWRVHEVTRRLHCSLHEVVVVPDQWAIWKVPDFPHREWRKTISKNHGFLTSDASLPRCRARCLARANLFASIDKRVYWVPDDRSNNESERTLGSGQNCIKIALTSLFSSRWPEEHPRLWLKRNTGNFPLLPSSECRNNIPPQKLCVEVARMRIKPVVTRIDRGWRVSCVGA